MTIDKSLRVRSGISRNRNVLSRSERLEKLMAADRGSEGDPVRGRPKVRGQKVALKKENLGADKNTQQWEALEGRFQLSKIILGRGGKDKTDPDNSPG